MGTAGATGSSTVGALLRGHWYDAMLAVLDESGQADGVGDRAADLARARELVEVARRVLDLDAEDFTAISRRFDAPWAARLADSSFPAEPRDPVRGALGSLVPLYELMLEVLQVRALRREPLQVVVTAHLIGEYLIQLAWESTLGHGGDPLRLATFVGGSRWGTEDPACRHSSALRSTARRALHACHGDVRGYTTYLDRFHSRLGDALGVCALNLDVVARGDRPDIGEPCPNPCAFITGLGLEHRRDLDARVRLAILYSRLTDRRAATPRAGWSLLRGAVGRGDLRGLVAHLGEGLGPVARRHQPAPRSRADQPGSGAGGAARYVGAGVGGGRPTSGPRSPAA